jgi:hypothetical protein
VALDPNADHLVLEEAIRARLEAQVASARHHLTVADLEGVQEEEQKHPAVHVVYNGDQVGGDSGDGWAQKITQDWMVVVAVRNQRGGRSGSGARGEAGPIVSEVLTAMQGWSPEPATFDPFVRVSAPGPAAPGAGFFYVPLVFRTGFATYGEQPT